MRARGFCPALPRADAAQLAARLDSLTGKDYMDAYVKLAKFVIPKLQRTALADEANRRIEVMMNLNNPWQGLSNRLTAVRLGE